MTLELDYSGATREEPKAGDGDIVGPAGQKEVTKGAPPSTEQIAAWGGITGTYDCIQETPEKAVPMSFIKEGSDESVGP